MIYRDADDIGNHIQTVGIHTVEKNLECDETKRQKNAWKPFFIVISVDGREYYDFVMPDTYSGSYEQGNYVGQSIQICEKLSGKKCFVFADKYKIIFQKIIVKYSSFTMYGGTLLK